MSETKENIIFNTSNPETSEVIEKLLDSTKDAQGIGCVILDKEIELSILLPETE
jgi:hypothetical protein